MLRSAPANAMEPEVDGAKWICMSCGFVYDPAKGHPEGDIPPGTPFDAISSIWRCPVCGASKRDFTPLAN